MNIYTLQVSVYHRVIEDSSFLLLRKPTKHKSKRFEMLREQYFARSFDKMNCQLIDKFGVNREVEMIFYKRNSILRNKIKEILSGENHETDNLFLEREIDQMKKRLGEHSIKDIHQHHARMYRMLEERYKRSAKTLTVFEFYTDLNDLKKEIELQKQTKPRKLNGKKDSI